MIVLKNKLIIKKTKKLQTNEGKKTTNLLDSKYIKFLYITTL